MARVFFASPHVRKLAVKFTLPAKFQQMLDAVGLPSIVAGKRVCIKMHMGAKLGKSGFTTIHPLFVRFLVDKIKEAGAQDVFVTDEQVEGCEIRGYTEQTFGCPSSTYFPKEENRVLWTSTSNHLTPLEVGVDLLDADVLIVFSQCQRARGLRVRGGGQKYRDGMRVRWYSC